MADMRRPAWVDDELFPFESRFIAIDGHTVHYVTVEGAGHFVQSDALDRFAAAIRDWHTLAAGRARPAPHGTETHVLPDGRV
jgi:hypothetical protein